jgi:hypothetical protein
MIETESNELHLILHDHPAPPRLLIIPKARLKRFLIIAPLIVVCIISSLVLTIMWSGTKNIKVQIPSLPTSTNSIQIDDLRAELKSLQLAQSALQLKLSTQGAPEIDIWLGPIKKPYALQNLTAKKLLRIENTTLEDGAGKRVLRFQLINTGSEQDRVTGHIFVFQIDSRGLAPYPAMTQQEWLEGIRYNKGESFAVARLRPVEAPFPPADTEARFLVVVFNREGDLLIRQELVGPFKTGAP